MEDRKLGFDFVQMGRREGGEKLKRSAPVGTVGSHAFEFRRSDGC